MTVGCGARYFWLVRMAYLRAFFGVIIVAAPAFILIAVFAIYMGTPHFRNPKPKRAIEAGGSVYGTFS